MKEMKNIESDVFGGLAGVVEVHVNLLKGLEKGVKSWPFSLASVMSEGLKTEGLKLLEKYSVSLATHQSQLAIIEVFFVVFLLFFWCFWCVVLCGGWSQVLFCYFFWRRGCEVRFSSSCEFCFFFFSLKI